MIVLSGADLVLPGRVQQEGTLVIDGDRIAEIRSGLSRRLVRRSASREGGSGQAAEADATGADAIDLRGHIVLPGFVDVHVHGVEGIDTLDGGNAIAALAERLTKYGVTAFCPTTVACAPDALRQVLQSVAALRSSDAPAARVLPAHLESNFINPEYRGAQPAGCLRSPAGLSRRSGIAAEADATGLSRRSGKAAEADAMNGSTEFDGRAILDEIDAAGESAGIVTVAPELEGALDLIRHLVARGHRVSLGHSGATLEQSRAAIAAGARRATHLFNRMPPLGHREPGLAGAILTSEEVAAEIICDGVHVHRDMVRMALAAKGVDHVMAITDGVAVAGLSDGATATLGGQTICVKGEAAYLADGTLAGSTATMDRVFRFLVKQIGLSLCDAAQLCAMTPATELALRDTGTLTKGAIADLIVMDRDLNVKQTYVSGRLVYSTL